LGEQLAELKVEIEGVELRFCFGQGLEPGRAAIKPASWATGLSSKAGGCAWN